MSMFCNQCQEALGNKGCTKVGVCGKNEEVALLQDLLMYVLQGVSDKVIKSGSTVDGLGELNGEMMNSLFMTITNANFDPAAIEKQIVKMLKLRDDLPTLLQHSLHDAAWFTVEYRQAMLEKAEGVGVLSIPDEDVRSLRSLIILGLKGMAAYTEHARNIGKENPDIYRFTYEVLAATLDDSLSIDDLVSLVMKTGEYGVKAMALLDEANTSRYGKPEMTQVSIGVRGNPGILISGHDLTDLEQLLEQTRGTGVDVYTHSEMLPAHYYPFFKKYDNFAGNYGNSWWMQVREFAPFHGPILFTTNCIVPPRSPEMRDRIFTTGSAGYPGSLHVRADAKGKKDFSPIIAMAKQLPPPEAIEEGTIVGGFAHDQVFALADQVADAVKSGAIKKFFVMAGCDGRMKSREYYTQFASQLPPNTVIMTAGRAKYR